MHESIFHDILSRALKKCNKHFALEDELSIILNKTRCSLAQTEKKEIVSETDLKLSLHALVNSTRFEAHSTRSEAHTQKFKLGGNSKQHSYNSLRLDEIFKVKSFIEWFL